MSIYLQNLNPKISYVIGQNGDITFNSDHGSVVMNCARISHSTGFGVKFWFSDKVYNEIIFKSAKDIIDNLSKEVNEIFYSIETKAKVISS